MKRLHRNTTVAMMISMRSVLIAGLALFGCSSSHSTPPSVHCAQGELTGTWRLHYTEVDGTCGPIQDETVNLTAVNTPGSPSSPSACTTASDQVSSDKCVRETDFTCPPADGEAGTVHWTLSTKQVSDTEIQGTGTVEIRLGTRYCRSTYNTDLVKL